MHACNYGGLYWIGKARYTLNPSRHLPSSCALQGYTGNVTAAGYPAYPEFPVTPAVRTVCGADFEDAPGGVAAFLMRLHCGHPLCFLCAREARLPACRIPTQPRGAEWGGALDAYSDLVAVP